MNLDFKVLVIDDEAASAQAALSILSDHLDAAGFEMKVTYAQDLTAAGIKRLAKNSGKDFDLVIIDFGLGTDIDGSVAIVFMRKHMPFTDIVYFSSHLPRARAELMEKEVDGVFTTERDTLPETLIGVADTIIGKAVDLNHMRGITMAEVAEMDVLLENTLLRVFSADPEVFDGATREVLREVRTWAKRQARLLLPLIRREDILTIIGNGTLFSSTQKYKAVRALAKGLPRPPSADLDELRPYPEEVLNKRNILAHAKEQLDEHGNVSLRAVRHSEPPVQIDDRWLTDYRKTLRRHRRALDRICAAVISRSDEILLERAAARPPEGSG